MGIEHSALGNALARFLNLISDELQAPKNPYDSVSSRWSTGIKRGKVNYFIMGDIILKDSDPAAHVAVEFFDAKGVPTTPDDVPQWATSDATVATVTPAADGLTAMVAPGVASATPATISVTSTDKDGTKIVGSGHVTVEPGEAATANLTFTPGP